MTDRDSIAPATVEIIRDWLVRYVADTLKVDPNDVDVTRPFQDYGLDSVASVILTGDLGEWLGQDLEPTLLLDYPDIETLARCLGQSPDMEEVTL